MKHFVVLMALVCVLCASVTPVKAVSNTELQDTSRFARIISKGDTGGGDGKYIELSTIRDNSTNAHTKNIEAKILAALDEAIATIDVSVAWFTNVTLQKKLLEKKKAPTSRRKKAFWIFVTGKEYSPLLHTMPISRSLKDVGKGVPTALFRRLKAL